MNPIERWHSIIEHRELAGLDELLADDVVFHSPVVYQPQRGKAITRVYLTAAFHVLFNDSFRYIQELVDKDRCVLEFETEIDGTYFNGVDIIRWNEAGQIVEFKVMVRPLRAIQLIHQMMAEMLQNIQAGK